jgi:hypothetical protein
MVHLHTTDTSLRVVARKSAAGQLAAHAAPPAALTGNLITARVHESAVNNILEEKLGGRVFTKADVERIAKAKKEAEEKPEWDKSVTSEKRTATVEDRMASKIAQEVLRDNAKLRAVHSGNSLKHLLEREAKR